MLLCSFVKLNILVLLLLSYSSYPIFLSKFRESGFSEREVDLNGL